ncbi:S-adenosylmethionine-dependent nucleotide dehydratase RSAD2 isoform X2 [Hyla sarda]|uniref:S-adenosylmethionine-dependent nucleotide dehydratase RSAD2 isoform X2 n=1 Tax=Hyla sarda TaxID=327740 RepID=UPI0024C3813E|nr:S-adenosylmethionine-dependent nucleotide dehydratase RSAD2 isoform X2 [Hyla sarda]
MMSLCFLPIMVMLKVVRNNMTFLLECMKMLSSWCWLEVFGAKKVSSPKINAPQKDPGRVKPISVNYHFTRQCNYKCGFCFHTAKTSFVLPVGEAKKGLAMLKDAGMQKINFSGGEPFMQDRGNFVGKLVVYCKKDLKLPSVSIVSNGSLITEKWFKSYGEHLDILAVSCDSFNEDVNKLIGRGQGQKNHVEKLMKIRQWCCDYNVAFKINSVINSYNVDEDMREEITMISPIRWKVFQCLIIDGENSGEEALRQAETFVITDDEFKGFLDRHKDIKCLVPESNQQMRDSYLILDEYGNGPQVEAQGSRRPVLQPYRKGDILPRAMTSPIPLLK